MDVNGLLKQMTENTFELQRMRDAMAYERREAERDKNDAARERENLILRFQLALAQANRELQPAPPQISNVEPKN